MTKLVLRRDAYRDLGEIDAFSIERFGQEAAVEYMAALRRAFHRLREFPLSGAVFEGIRPPVRYASCGSHRIFYDYMEKDGLVLVLRVLHQAMAPDRHIRRM